jgi:hypothetical protein
VEIYYNCHKHGGSRVFHTAAGLPLRVARPNSFSLKVVDVVLIEDERQLKSRNYRLRGVRRSGRSVRIAP